MGETGPGPSLGGAAQWSPRVRGLSPDVADDEVGWGNEEIVHSREGGVDKVLALASAGFCDHLQHTEGILVRAHPSRGLLRRDDRRASVRGRGRNKLGAAWEGHGWGTHPPRAGSWWDRSEYPKPSLLLCQA